MSTPSGFHLTDACTEAHFTDMSLLHALGWRTAYRDFIPEDYMRREITDGRWTPVFRENDQTGRYHGLVLYRGARPVCCATYGPARTGSFSAGETVCDLWSPDLADWGELVSLYCHPEERGKGYGSLVLREVLERLSGAGRPGCLLFVLRENEGARRFYARHGFAWDGTQVDVPIPPDTVLTDLRYTRKF